MHLNFLGGKSSLLLFALVSIMLMGYQANSFFLARTAAKWPQVDGQIVSSSLESRESFGRRGRRTTVEQAVVQYDYLVDGQQYTNDQISVTDGSLKILRGNGKDSVENYPVGQAVSVWYDPANPANAVLETSLPMSSYLWVGGATVVLAVCGVGCFIRK